MPLPMPMKRMSSQRKLRRGFARAAAGVVTARAVTAWVVTAWVVTACLGLSAAGCTLSERDEDLAIRGHRIAPTAVREDERLAMPEVRTLDADRRARVTMLGDREATDDLAE